MSMVRLAISRCNNKCKIDTKPMLRIAFTTKIFMAIFNRLSKSESSTLTPELTTLFNKLLIL